MCLLLSWALSLFCFICSEALELGTHIYNCEVLANILFFSSWKVTWPLGAFFVLFCMIVTICVNVLDISMHDGFPSFYFSDWSFLLDQLIGLSIFKIEQKLYLLFSFSQILCYHFLVSFSLNICTSWAVSFPLSSFLNCLCIAENLCSDSVCWFFFNTLRRAPRSHCQLQQLGRLHVNYYWASFHS